MARASENDPSAASIDVFECRFYCCICGDIAAQRRQKKNFETHCIYVHSEWVCLSVCLSVCLTSATWALSWKPQPAPISASAQATNEDTLLHVYRSKGVRPLICTTCTYLMTIGAVFEWLTDSLQLVPSINVCKQSPSLLDVDMTCPIIDNVITIAKNEAELGLLILIDDNTPPRT